MLSARSPGVRRGPQGPGVPGWTQKRGFCGWLGPGNTNVQAGWVPGRVVYRVLPHPWYTLPAPTRYPPRTPPTAPPVLPSLLPGSAHLVSTKEILGVGNAHRSPGTLTQPAIPWLVPFGCCALLARGRLSAPTNY